MPRTESTVHSSPATLAPTPAIYRRPLLRLVLVAFLLILAAAGLRYYLARSMGTPSLEDLYARANAHPDSADALKELGARLAAAGQPEEGVRYLSRAAQLRPQDVHCRIELGHALLTVGQTGAAAEQIDRALELDPGSADGWFYHGAILMRQSRPNDAAVALRKALAIQPDHPAALLDLGALDTVAMGHHANPPRWLASEALEHLRRYSLLSPKDAHGWYLLALAEGAAKKAHESVADMDRSIQLDETVGPAWIFRARQKELLGAPDAAIEADVKQGLGLDRGNSEGYAILGRLEMRKGNLQSAVGHFTQAIRLSPTRLLSKDSLYRRAQGEMQLGQATDSRRDMAERSRLDSLESAINRLMVSPRPADPAYYEDLARLYREDGDLDHSRQNASIAATLRNRRSRVNSLP